LWCDILWSLIVRRTLGIYRLQLALKLSLAVTSSFNFSTLSRQSCLFLLGFSLCRFLSTLLFFLFDLASLDLLLEVSQTGLSSLTLLGYLAFLTCRIVPT
jgi:hypothetical protein